MTTSSDQDMPGCPHDVHEEVEVMIGELKAMDNRIDHIMLNKRIWLGYNETQCSYCKNEKDRETNETFDLLYEMFKELESQAEELKELAKHWRWKHHD